MYNQIKCGAIALFAQVAACLDDTKDTVQK